MKCVCIRGCPGSGKSTFAMRVFPGVFHIENDMYHMKDGKYEFNCRKQDEAIGWCLDMCDKALAGGMDVIVSNTFTKPGYVEAYRRIAEKYGAKFEVYRMHGDFENVHSVPAGVLQNMRSHFRDWPGEKHVYPNGDSYSVEDTARG